MDLDELIDTYRGPLIGLIASWGAPWSDAMELAQDSLAEAWLRRSSCRGDVGDPEVFGKWLRGFAWNCFRNWRRVRWRHRLRLVSLDSMEREPEEASLDGEPSEAIEALRRAISRLPEKQRQVVLMHYLEETSVKNVAVLLSVSEKTVEGRLFQARRSLRRLLSESTESLTIKVWLCL